MTILTLLGLLRVCKIYEPRAYEMITWNKFDKFEKFLKYC